MNENVHFLSLYANTTMNYCLPLFFPMIPMIAKHFLYIRFGFLTVKTHEMNIICFVQKRKSSRKINILSSLY